MKIGEILGLRWPHIVPINHHVKILADLPRAIHHDFVFTYRHEPIGTLGGIKKSFITACGRAGITQGRAEAEGVIFHDIRRTVKTNMLAAGVDKVYRDTILGHSLKGMDVHYLAPSEEDLHRAMAVYTAWLDAQIANRDQNRDEVNLRKKSLQRKYL